MSALRTEFVRPERRTPCATCYRGRPKRLWRVLEAGWVDRSGGELVKPGSLVCQVCRPRTRTGEPPPESPVPQADDAVVEAIYADARARGIILRRAA